LPSFFKQAVLHLAAIGSGIIANQARRTGQGPVMVGIKNTTGTSSNSMNWSKSGSFFLVKLPEGPCR